MVGTSAKNCSGEKGLNMDYSNPKDIQIIEKTIAALKTNGIDSVVVESSELAKQKVLELIPEGAEVMTMTSKTLEETELDQVLNDTEKYNPIRQKLMDKNVDPREKKRLGSAPDYTVGSVHAVTEDGHVLIASNTGSQLASYVYGADHVIWIVGTQKIVKDFDEGLKRLYEYTLPLESERAHQAYGVPGSFISKLVVVNKEITPGRITLIFINKKLGF
jgi:L-lactate utilization protein LutC